METEVYWSVGNVMQIFSMSTPDDIIINAENLWKRKLGTKEYGMNAN